MRWQGGTSRPSQPSMALSVCCRRDPAKYADSLGGKKGVELVAGDVTDVQARGAAAAIVHRS